MSIILVGTLRETNVILWVDLILSSSLFFHRENDGTLGMVPLIIKPIYTLYSGYLDVFIG